MTMPLDAMSDVSDTALLVRFANGDRLAAAALTDRLAPRALGFAARLLGDVAEAEDVTQEAMLRLWKIAPEWRQGEAEPATWLYRVVRNLCTDRLRKRTMLDVEAVAEPSDKSPSVEASLIAEDRTKALQVALNQLPERQREAVVLRHIEGLANPQIAQIMEISTEAVESLTARGKRALTTALIGRREELGYDD